MKKVLILFLCIILAACALVACNNTDGEQINIGEYKIVVPSDCNMSTEHAAQNLAALIKDKTGKELSIVYDSEAPAANEILIGETNREESKTTTPLDKMQYLLFVRNGKIVMKGDGIYVGAACGDFINKYAIIDTSSGVFDIENVPDSESALNFEFSDTCRNVIFMIGDGMGENHIKMAEKNGMGEFIARSFPNIATSVTRSQSVINKEATFTDSAAGGTAMSTGYKTLNGYIGLDPDGNSVMNIRELAFSLGAKTAVLTTDVITGATPSSYLCHNVSRENDEELEAEINLLISEGKIDYCLGDVAENLTSETEKALYTVSKNGSRFFIMIEEGYIDKASHNKDEESAIEYVKRFNEAISYATQFTLCHPDTALVVTADHETGKLTAASGGVGYYFLSYNHTNIDVPVFAIGAKTDELNGRTLENTELAKFCASAYTSEPFGQTVSIE